MPKYRKKPIVIEAVLWFKIGDHPRVVKWSNDVKTNYQVTCFQCKTPYGEHGSIATLEGSHIVCSGDWIITGIKGEHYPCKPDIFLASYEQAEE